MRHNVKIPDSSPHSAPPVSVEQNRRAVLSALRYFDVDFPQPKEERRQHVYEARKALDELVEQLGRQGQNIHALYRQKRSLEEQLEVYATALRKIEETPWFLDTWNVGSAEVRRIARAALYPASDPATVPDEPCLDCTHDYCRCKERASFASLWRSNERSDT